MDFQNFNNNIAMVKNIIKAIPKENTGKYQPLIEDFYELVINFDSAYKNASKNINKIQNDLNAQIKTSSKKVNEIFEKFKDVN